MNKINVLFIATWVATGYLALIFLLTLLWLWSTSSDIGINDTKKDDLKAAFSIASSAVAAVSLSFITTQMLSTQKKDFFEK